MEQQQSTFSQFSSKSTLDELDNSVLDTEFEVGSSSDNTGDSKLGDRQESQRIVSMLDDPVFQNLTQLISHNPSQVLRYDLGGKPLLYSGKDDIYKIFNNKDGEFKIPIPGYNPSSTRQFELQLMPQAILDLEKDNIDIINGMEWGTIIVCTDVEDYMPHLDENHVGYIEEWCGVQWEESV
ncbi:hypothetical protein PACTADRAFT_1150 [Pachysolen tannophilus NRRL Y-2460]|uniref:Programmed cell death protein 2 C-terminal domain-containing protein n=1 Tax=Pachysolen tannophilus NRRL Y-2460 TaxID=669874 RepID=A0A1E4TXW7_PACTA|nr:hypothetical protein PACTADRAFT_1150 [Pachysolen tannophilus NRRL Y-2460]